MAETNNEKERDIGCVFIFFIVFMFIFTRVSAGLMFSLTLPVRATLQQNHNFFGENQTCLQCNCTNTYWNVSLKYIYRYVS